MKRSNQILLGGLVFLLVVTLCISIGSRLYLSEEMDDLKEMIRHDDQEEEETGEEETNM